MNQLLQKNDPAAIGKPVTASMPVDYHSAATNSPTGYGAGAWSNMGTLLAWTDAPDGSTWLEVNDGSETKYLRFIPGSFYLLDGAGQSTKLKFLQKPVAVFGSVAAGILLLAVIIGAFFWNYLKNNHRA